MDKSNVLHDRVQLNLFHPQPTLPQWTQLPTEVREAACELLVQMLSTYLVGHASGSHEGESDNE